MQIDPLDALCMSAPCLLPHFCAALGLSRHEPVLVQVSAAGAHKSLRIAGTATPDRSGGGGGSAGRRASFSLKASAGGASGDEATPPSRVR